MKLLLIHQNFPGQFKHLARAWAARPGWELVAIGRDTAPGLPDCPGLKLIRYRPHRGVGQAQHPYLRRMEDAVLHGQQVARILLRLQRQGWRPDAILAHPGWGETLYAKDVFPDARLLHFCEWYYRAQGADIGFDPEFPVSFDDRARIRSWNALHLLNLENCDLGVSPTLWQKAQHPPAYADKIVVAHEGIATEILGPDASARFKTPSGVTLQAGDPVVTFVARNLEPYRGFHTFMRALPALQAAHPRCHTLIVGGDEVSYGARPRDAKNWKDKLLAELGHRLDPTRTHFLGKLPYADYRRVLQVSAAHAYLSVPFVLSWSCLEAMATGCLLVGADTAPVREVIEPGRNGLLVPPLDPAALARGLAQALEPGAWDALRQRARQEVVGRFGREAGRRAYEDLLGVDRVAGGSAGGERPQLPAKGMKLGNAA